MSCFHRCPLMNTMVPSLPGGSGGRGRGEAEKPATGRGDQKSKPHRDYPKMGLAGVRIDPRNQLRIRAGQQKKGSDKKKKRLGVRTTVLHHLCPGSIKGDATNKRGGLGQLMEKATGRRSRSGIHHFGDGVKLTRFELDTELVKRTNKGKRSTPSKKAGVSRKAGTAGR